MRQIITMLLVLLLAQGLIIPAWAEEGSDAFAENADPLTTDTTTDTTFPVTSESIGEIIGEISSPWEDAALSQETPVKNTESALVEPERPAETQPIETIPQSAGETTAPTQEATQPGGIVFPVEPTVPEETTEPTVPNNPTLPNDPTIPSDPTVASEPTAPDEPTVPSDSAIPQLPTELQIDSTHIYPGMDSSYQRGYIPSVSGDMMYLVLPLIPTGPIYGNKIDVSLTMDTGSSSPFIVSNYRESFYMESIVPENDTQPQELFLVLVDVSLSPERKNGNYPIVVNIKGFNAEAAPIDCTFTLYVTIKDGKVEKPTVQSSPETPTAEPVVYISRTVIEPQTVQAGGEFTMTLTLKNSLTTKFVRNMLVTVNTGNVQISLLEDASIFPIDRIDAGGEAELILHLKTDESIPAGKYPISLSFAYDSSKSLRLSSSDTSVVEIQQAANMELVLPRITKSVSVGETVPLTFQVMNMGRSAMYNVRCVLSGFGFVPNKTGFIGTMAAGTSSTTQIDAYIIALNVSEGNENGAQYGMTTGTVTLLYEDEKGRPYKQSASFETEVKRPVVDLSQIVKEPEDEKTASQWWISVLILGGVILACIIAILLTGKKRRKSGAYL